MKTILLLSLLIGCVSAFGQTESEYYHNPVDTTIYSRYLGEKRNITLILPKSFSRNKETRYPVIVVFDRQNRRIFRQIVESINYLVSFDEMPEAVIIGVSTVNNQKRFFETSLKASAENASGEKLARFLFDELLPWAEAGLNVGQSRIFIGHSRFAYYTSYLLSSRINELSAVISLSPFYVQPGVNLVDSLKNRLSTNRLQHTVYYRFVTGDSITDTREYSLMKSMLSRQKKMETFNWKGLEFYNARHMAVPGLGISPSLLEIFDYWSDAMTRVLQSEKPFHAGVYHEFRKQMHRHYGDSIGLGLAVLNGIGYKFYNLQKYADARAAWQIVLQEYPMFTDARISIANAYSKEGNYKMAADYLEKAKNELKDNDFYTSEQRQEILAEIEDRLKKLPS